MSFALLGFFVLPLLPTVIELTAEVTYPYCSEDVAVGTLFVAATLLELLILSLHISSSMRTAMFPPKRKERKTLRGAEQYLHVGECFGYGGSRTHV